MRSGVASMISILKNVYFKFKLHIAVFFAAVGAFFLVKRLGKEEQKQENYREQMERIEEMAAAEITRQRAENDAVVDAVQQANKVKDENSRISDDDSINKLREYYTRD